MGIKSRGWNMEKEKISVIVPVYNVEKYLAKCLDSIVNQTYDNLEIILVDDVSLDGSGKICDEYAARDRRVRVIHRTENGGASCARNDGLDVAAGDYIMFMDSDDWMAEDACETLLDGLREYQADCCVGHCSVVLDRDDKLIPLESARPAVHCDTSVEAMKTVLLKEAAAWNRIYPRRVFENQRFIVGRINEDEVMMLRLYAEMERIVFLDKDTYYYRKRPNSVTTSAFSVKQMDFVYNSLENLEFVREKAPELVPCAEYKYIKTMLWCYVNLRKVRDDDRVPELRRKLRCDIKANRRTAMNNGYLSFPLKVLALLCGF